MPNTTCHGPKGRPHIRAQMELLPRRPKVVEWNPKFYECPICRCVVRDPTHGYPPGKVE